jgi:hypothetical protein
MDSQRYKVVIAFYVEAEDEEQARFIVEDGIGARLATDYDWLDTEGL